MKVSILIPVSVALIPLTAMAGSPGLVTVVGEPPVTLNPSLPASSAYKFTYDPARLSIWDTVTKDNLIAPGAEFTAPAIAGDFEPDCDVDLSDVAKLQVCFTGAGGGPPAPGCEVFDFEPDSDVDLTDFGVLQPNVSGPGQCGMVPVTVFVEGLTASTTPGDTTIDVLTDPDGDSTFDVQETRAVTVVSIDIAPTSGPPGTLLTVTMQPAIAPFAFDSTTTADWEGVYQPPDGPPTAPFQVAYDADQFRESSAGEAILIVGDGTITNVPDFENLDGPGTTPGTFTFNLAGLTLSRSFAFAPESNAPVWEMIAYPYDGMDPPTIDGEPNNLQQLLLSELPDPNNPTEQLLLAANDFHFAAVMRIEENPSTVADAPSTILVDLISFDSNETEIDRLEGVVLQRLDPDDDPEHLVYHNDLTVPIVLVDTSLNKDNYPNVLLLYVVTDGSAGIVPVLD